MRTKSSVKPDLAPAPNLPGEPLLTEKCTCCHVLNFKQILVPVDFSECSAAALDCAVIIAMRFESKITLLHVVEPAAYPENSLLTPSSLDETNQSRMTTARERLARLQKTKGQGCSIEALVRMGRAQSEIPDTAKAIGAELIVLGTYGFSGVKKSLLGGTAERVLHHAPCPVLTIRRPATG